MSCSEECKCRPGVVALVFIPGIMGTRLMNRDTGDSVWDPAAGAGNHTSGAAIAEREAREAEMDAAQTIDQDSNWESLAKWFQRRWIDTKSGWDSVEEFGRKARRKAYIYPRVSDLLWAGPSDRKILLVNDKEGGPAYDRKDDLLDIDKGTDRYFEVYTSVPPAQVEDKRDRGWGEVHWDSYGGFLRYLENKGGELSRDYSGLRFPVYAIGYNWMLSNEEAGNRIKDRLSEIRQKIVAEDERGISDCDVKIIMVTHSMGGYAGRSAFALSGVESEVESVIHGAMPTHGSPSTYKQLRAGQSGGAKLILGKNAADMTAILGYCQGGLELLPNQLYRTAENTDEWLFLDTEDGDGGDVLDVGYGSGIFNFYSQFDNWYSMVQPILLAPELAKDMVEASDLKAYKKSFVSRIGKCRSFHNQLSDKFHATSSLIFSISTHDKAFDRCVWVGDGAPDGEADEWAVNSHENHSLFFGDGTVKLFGPEDEARFKSEVEQMRNHHPNEAMAARIPRLDTVAFTIAGESAPGDGTVHAGAGKYPTSSAGLKKLPLEATEEHQGFYNCPYVRDLVLAELQSWIPDIHSKLGG